MLEKRLSLRFLSRERRTMIGLESTKLGPTLIGLASLYCGSMLAEVNPVGEPSTLLGFALFLSPLAYLISHPSHHISYFAMETVSRSITMLSLLDTGLLMNLGTATVSHSPAEITLPLLFGTPQPLTRPGPLTVFLYANSVTTTHHRRHHQHLHQQPHIWCPLLRRHRL